MQQQTLKHLTQQICETHKKPISGICTEDVCKYSSRILCVDCQFTHQKCNLRMEVKSFQTDLLYILNPEQHKCNCTFFPENSKLQSYIDDAFDKVKNKFKHHMLDIEQKYLAFLLQEQGLVNTRWAQQLINLKNLNLSKQEYDSAVIMLKEKSTFDKSVVSEIKSIFDKLHTMTKSTLELIMGNFHLQNLNYDIQQLYQEASKTLNKQKDYTLDIEDKLKQQRFKLLSGGHGTETSIVSIIETPTHIISGSDSGVIAGWFMPAYSLDFRIKANEGLNALGIAKFQSQNIIFAGGQGTIQAFSLQTKQKLYSLEGHRLQIQKLQSYSLKNLISASQDGTIKLWDIQERKAIKTFTAHQGSVSDFVLEKELISVGQDGTINFIDIGSQTIRKSTQLQIPIYSIGIIKSGKYALGMGDGTIKVLKGNAVRDYRIGDEVIYRYSIKQPRILPLNKKQILCYSAEGNICLLNLKKSAKIFKSQIQKDGPWQALALIQNQFLIPHQGNIKVYQI